MVIQKAKELGQALFESAQYQRMQHAQSCVAADAALGAMIEEFTLKRRKVADMLSEEDMDVAAVRELSHEVERLNDAMHEHPLFIEMMEARTAFQELMNLVNNELSLKVGGGGTASATAACSGNCAACNGGCTH